MQRDGHEVEWVGDWSTDPGDEQILGHAAQNSQVLVTLDKDFGELAVAFGAALPESSGLSIFATLSKHRCALVPSLSTTRNWPKAP